MLFLIIGLIIRHETAPQPINQQQTAMLASAVDEFFNKKIAEQQRVRQNQPTQISSAASRAGQTIMAVIYLKPDATWFIKAQGETTLVDQMAKIFSRLFLQNLTFKVANAISQPDFSHIPSEYRSTSKQSMRFATFNLNGLDVSVTKLGANQDVTANITRWKKQLGLAVDAPEFVKYQDNKQTVLVRLTSLVEQQNTQATEKEDIADFMQFSFDLSASDKWKLAQKSSSMASAILLLTDQGREYEVAVLRLPSSVPMETIFGIWKQKLGIDVQQSTATSSLQSDAAQSWILTPLSTPSQATAQPQHLLIAAHKGTKRYTFLRISSPGEISESAKKEFIDLLKQIKIK